MNKERIRRSIAAIGIGVASAFVADRIVSNPVSVSVRHEAPVAVLPESRILISFPERRLK